MADLRVMYPVGAADLHETFVIQLRPRLMRALEGAGRGQRLRVTTLPEPVMNRVCESLQGNPDWVVRVLVERPAAEPWKATATKLIELRNVLPEPLLVFIPDGLRIAAEDSLDIATFNELPMGMIAGDLIAALLGHLSEQLKTSVAEELSYLREQRHIRNPDEEIEYLLTIVKNGASAEAAGGALYALGLIPDFELFTRGSTRFWLTRNMKARQRLTDGQPLQTSILRLPLRKSTVQTTLFSFLRTRQIPDVRDWAREIACDPQHRILSLDQWEFIDDGGEKDELRLILEPLELPRQSADPVSGATGSPVFNLAAKDPLKVSFRSIPAPPQALNWKSWRVQVLSVRDGVPTVAWESNSFPKAAKHSKVSRAIKVADLQSLEEGTYYLKVDAYDADGALLTTPHRLGEDGATAARQETGASRTDGPPGRAENESEIFLVVHGDVVVEEVDIRAVYVPSLLDAWVQVAKKALGGKRREPVPDRRLIRGRWSEPIGAAPRGDSHFELKTHGFAGYTVVVPSMLRKLEAEILQYPDQLGIYSLSFADARTLADVEVKRRELIDLGDGIKAVAFIEARRAVFQAILRHGLEGMQESPTESAFLVGIVETVDLESYDQLIERYARSYIDLANSAALEPSNEESNNSSVRGLVHLDMVELRWRRAPADPGRAILVAPTHPLRLLWHLRHMTTCRAAVRAWDDDTAKVPRWNEFLEELRRKLLPLNLPMVVLDRRRRAHVEHTPVTAFWPLYLPDRAESDAQIDAVAVRDRVLGHLCVRERAMAPSTVDASIVAVRLFEYVVQHPYVEQLCINVFNPGDGAFIADVLRWLERIRFLVLNRDTRSLRYAVHLFTVAQHIETSGDGLESLLDPERQVGEDDEFTLTTTNHLLPKLVFSRNALDEFLLAPERFPAHVSLLIEHFAARGRVARIDGLRRGLWVEGLVGEPETQVEVKTGSHFGWIKGLRPTVRDGASSREQLLAAAVAAGQQVQASFALDQLVTPEVGPVVALQLDSAGQALLKQVHEVSDWVLTIDRNLGLDYFDSPASSRESGYLLDFAPEYLHEDRQRILLTTRSAIEIQKLIQPVMEQYGLPMGPGDELLILETLRSLSGRLALRLQSARSQAAEVVGLLLARWLLDRAGLLDQRIIIPLDVHSGWFTPGEESASQRRADLLLVGFDEPSSLRFDIVEVKLRDELTAAARHQLYDQMQKQADSTKDCLRRLFDPNLYPEPRADALLRAKELASVLGFYVRRARRYGLLSDTGEQRAFHIIDALDGGYHLDIRRLGVLFECRGRGTHIDEDRVEFPVHRFGIDKAEQLLAHAAGRFTERSRHTGDTSEGSLPPIAEGRAAPTLAAEFRDDEVAPLRTLLGVEQQRPPFRSAATSSKEGSGASGEPAPDSYGERPAAERSASGKAGEAGKPVHPEERPTPNKPAQESSSANDGAPSAMPEVTIADVLIGASEFSPQYGVIGKSAAQKVAIDLNGCNTISLFGVQGFGKSYTLGVIAEMASKHVAGINVLPSPLATVIFHYHKSDAYEPEYTTAVNPNAKAREIERLAREYGAHPTGLDDVVLLTSEAKVEQRRAEYPRIVVEPIKFSSSELGAESWKFLLGAYGNDALYIRQLVAIMRRHRSGLTIAKFRSEIHAAGLPAAVLRLAEDRLNLAEPYIDDDRRLGALLRPGRTVIVDLRDEWVEKDEALGLFVVMLRIFAASKFDGRDFNKLVLFDEAHKYITESDLIGQVVETIREMRHQATSVVIASQDPLSVPRAVIELTSILILHRLTSPQWLKHLKSALSSLKDVEEGNLTSLTPGEALVWAQRSTDKQFTLRPRKVQIRPRFTQHGGGTKTAVEGATVR